MDRADLHELHYITAIDNVASILAQGIESHNRAQALAHVSVASTWMQEIRSKVTVPNGLRLHDYANLYVWARNGMMSKIIYDSTAPKRLCVLRIDTTVFDRGDVVVTDCNAGSDYVRWFDVVQGIAELNQDEVFAQSWNHPNKIEKWIHKSRMMAEVLVPRRVPPGYITGAYIVSDEAAANLSQMAPTLAVEVQPYMFCKGPRP